MGCFERSLTHPRHKNKDAPRMGHPFLPGEQYCEMQILRCAQDDTFIQYAGFGAVGECFES
jgi:hypothetical protein